VYLLRFNSFSIKIDVRRRRRRVARASLRRRAARRLRNRRPRCCFPTEYRRIADDKSLPPSVYCRNGRRQSVHVCRCPPTSRRRHFSVNSGASRPAASYRHDVVRTASSGAVVRGSNGVVVDRFLYGFVGSLFETTDPRWINGRRHDWSPRPV